MADSIQDIFAALASGACTSEQAEAQAQRLLDDARGFADHGFARPDIQRSTRQGTGEVIFGEGKSADQVASIARTLCEAGQPAVLATRLDAEKAAVVEQLWDAERAVLGSLPAFSYDATSRLGTFGADAPITGNGPIVVACAGTSDLPVAEEAARTARFLGNEVTRLYDVGVAGIHRLMACADELEGAQVVIAVAGMEGALASVVGGLVSCPVIAVPTSVGYGASFGGVTALLAMLNSCASGVSVVNIDNGFGAAYQASLINHL